MGRKRGLTSLRFALPVLVVGVASLGPRAGAQTLPTGFTDAQLASVSSPTDLNFLPDGRILVTTQNGALRVYCPNNTLPGCGGVPATGGLLTAVALNVPGICTGSERGLLGVAVDPNFGAGNTDIFLFFTATSPGAVGGCVNRVSRFTYNAANNTVSAASQVVLVDNMTSTAGNHNAGDVDFGKDGYLYITIGDGGCDYNSPSNCQDGNDAARDEHRLTGKVLRIDRNGGIPPSNPWATTGDRCNVTGGTTPGRRCQETYSWGHRNPFRFAFDPNATGTRFFINEVGGGAFEEVNEGTSGVDFGWNCREGRQVRSNSGLCSPAPPNMVDPVLAYGRSAVGASSEGIDTANCTSITGGAFVPNGAWSSVYDNTYLFADYACGRMFIMPATGYNRTRVPTFGSAFGNSSLTSLRFGPFPGGQALYYTSYAGGTAGGLHRIVYSFVKAVLVATPPGGPVGTTVTFDGSGSSDPNGLPINQYRWDFNGDGVDELTNASETATFTYNTCGVYNARLIVRNSSGQVSDPAIAVVSICAPPTPTIVAPTPAARFRVGQSVTLMGYARNSAGVLLPSSSIRWTVLLHHDAHTHPLVPEQTGTACTVTLPPGSTPPTVAGSCFTFTTPSPEDFSAAGNSYLDVLLEATDGQGLVGNAPTLAFQPNRVTLNFATDPPNQPLRLNGFDYATPLAAVSWESYVINAQANSQPQANGQNYVFAGWTDGVATNPRSITTPAATASYTARYRDDGTHPRELHLVTPCRAVDTRGTPGVPVGGPALQSGGTRILTLTGACGVPPGVRAVAANITVVSPTQAGDLRLFPVGGVGNTSAINFRAGQTRANNAVVTLSASGQVSVTCAMAAAGTTHFLVDVMGYFQ